jgi:hypothetical protein
MCPLTARGTSGFHQRDTKGHAAEIEANMSNAQGT